MADERNTADERKRRRRRWFFAAAVLTWLIVYPLSIGPVYWLFKHGHLTVETYFALVTGFYWPLHFFEPFWTYVILPYLSLWAPL